MKFDKYGLIELEQCGFPGNIGDGCAEYARYATLCKFLDIPISPNLIAFITDIGVLRHPNSIWGTSDTSDDQVSPLIAAAALYQPELADKIIAQLEAAGCKSGNGQYIHLTTFAQIFRYQKYPLQWLFDMSILGQTVFMLLPFRWSDSKHWFESNKNSSSDYLNWLNFLIFAKMQSFSWPCRLALKLISAEKTFEKIQDYYCPEPQAWIVPMYEQAIRNLYVA